MSVEVEEERFPLVLHDPKVRTRRGGKGQGPSAGTVALRKERDDDEGEFGDFQLIQPSRREGTSLRRQPAGGLISEVNWRKVEKAVKRGDGVKCAMWQSTTEFDDYDPDTGEVNVIKLADGDTGGAACWNLRTGEELTNAHHERRDDARERLRHLLGLDKPDVHDDSGRRHQHGEGHRSRRRDEGEDVFGAGTHMPSRCPEIVSAGARGQGGACKRSPGGATDDVDWPFIKDPDFPDDDELLDLNEFVVWKGLGSDDEE